MKYFLYCRKSEDDKKKQVLSIPAQRDEMMNLAATSFEDVEIVDILEEERTAKEPGRPIFNEMVKRIKRREAQGIIAWDPDRLARNSVDGGEILYMLDLGTIRDLKFATYKFENSAQGKFMLGLMFSQSKYYVDALSVNVKRGLRTKAGRGDWPLRAPLGYLNVRTEEGKRVIPDPERFALVQRMWQLFLSGTSIAAITKIAAEEWGLRKRSTSHVPGPLSRSGVYRLFSNPFYAGVYLWEGRTISGNHPPTVSLADFEAAQRLLQRPDRERPKRRDRDFALKEGMKCGTCGASITASEVTGARGKGYIYYRCSRRNVAEGCQQRAVREHVLEEQIISFLRGLAIPTHFLEWAQRRIGKEGEVSAEAVEAARASLARSVAANARAKANLLRLRLDERVTDEEFITERSRIEMETLRLASHTTELENARTDMKTAERLILFSNRAVDWFRAGDARIKRLILRAAIWKLTLTDGILSIQAQKPLLRPP